MRPNRDTEGAKRVPCKFDATKLETAAEQQLRNAFSLCSITALRCPGRPPILGLLRLSLLKIVVYS